MNFFIRLVMFSLVAGFSLGAVADDVEDCVYYLAKDYERALPVCSRAAKQGDVYAQFGLGRMYYNGYGVPKNDREAVKWFRLAAKQGFASAQYDLGRMYANGKGVTQDQQEAYIWFSLAVANGNNDASESRDRTAKLLTVSKLQIAQQEAQRRSAERRQEEERRRQEERKHQEEERKRQEEERKRQEEERKRQEKARLAEERRLAAANARAAQLANLRGIYIRRIIEHIESYLITPPSAHTNNLLVVVRVRLNSDGKLVDLPEVVESSGLPEYDKVAIRAIMQAMPLPMPSKYPEWMDEFKELNLYIRPQ